MMRVRWSAAAAAALLLTACTQTSPDPPASPISSARDALHALAEHTDGFTQFTANDDKLTAIAAIDGQPTFWALTPTLDARDATRLAYPSVPMADVDLDAMADRTQRLADECGDEAPGVEMVALTPSAMVSWLTCGDADAPTTVLVNDDPLPEFTGLWTVTEWDKLLDLVEAMSPEQSVLAIQISDTVQVQLASDSTTNGCRPSFYVPLDGSNLTWMCHSDTAQPAVLRDWTGQSLHDAVAGIADSEGITISNSTGYTIESDPAGLKITVRVDSTTATGSVSPG